MKLAAIVILAAVGLVVLFAVALFTVGKRGDEMEGRQE